MLIRIVKEKKRLITFLSLRSSGDISHDFFFVFLNEAYEGMLHYKKVICHFKYLNIYWHEEKYFE